VAWHLNRGAFDAASPERISPSCRSGAAGDPGLEAVRAGFATWEQPCSNLQLVYAGTSTEISVGTIGSGENVVVFREGWCSNHPQARIHPCYDDFDIDCGGLFNCFEDHDVCPRPPCADQSVVALTSVLYDPASGRILDADIEINGWNGVGGSLTTTPPAEGWYFTCYPDEAGQPAATCASYGEDGCKYMDLRNTVTHEVGHLVGLAHPCEENGTGRDCDLAPTDGDVPYRLRTMSPTTGPGDVAKRSLSVDDVAGVCAVYPEPDGGCGCGSAGTGGTLALLLAAVALRRPAGRPRSQ
jgi:hypothetical protein